MEDLRVLPHFMQQRTLSCGAACLRMLYQHYGLAISEDEIWERVTGCTKYNTKIRNCRTSLMVKDALNRGFICTAISADNALKTIIMCYQHGIELIILYHQRISSTNGHFGLVTNIRGGSVFVNNPEVSPKDGGINQRIKNIRDLMQISRDPTEDFGLSNTMLAFINPNDNLPYSMYECPVCHYIYPKVDLLKDYANAYLCPQCEFFN